MNDADIRKAANSVMNDLFPKDPIIEANKAIQAIPPGYKSKMADYTDDWMIKHGMLSDKRISEITSAIYVASKHVEDFSFTRVADQNKISIILKVSRCNYYIFRWRLKKIASDVFKTVAPLLPSWTIDVLISRKEYA